MRFSYGGTDEMNPDPKTLALTIGGMFFLPLLGGQLRGDDRHSPETTLPQAVSEENFRELLTHSPFTRSLNVSDTLVLTGVAQVEGRPVATILDTEVGRSILVSERRNDRGWKMVEISIADELESAIASISLESGEVFRVRYDEKRIKSTAQRLRYAAQARVQRQAAAVRSHSSGGGHGVPQERVAMLQRIDQNELPKGYNPGAGRNREESHRLHQTYVDRRLESMSDRQKGMVGQMWKQKTMVDAGMSNRGAAFVRILEHVAENEPR